MTVFLQSNYPQSKNVDEDDLCNYINTLAIPPQRDSR